MEGRNAEEITAALAVVVGFVPIGVTKLVDWRREADVRAAETLDLMEKRTALIEQQADLIERVATALESIAADPGGENDAREAFFSFKEAVQYSEAETEKE